MIKNKIDILTYHDNLHNPLYDIYFLPSYNKYMKTNFNLISHIVSAGNETDGTFESPHWSQMLINRFDILKQYVKKNIKQNKICIFSDIDIVFLDDIYNSINKIMTTNIDIVYMAENMNSPKHEINGGFFAFRCSNKIYEYFDYIQSETKKQKIPNDQYVIQNYLENNNILKINHSLLNKIHFMTNNNSSKIINNATPMIKVFHATSTTDLVEKCYILSQIIMSKRQFIKYFTIVN